MNLAGLPTTMVSGATSFATTLAAPTTALSPTVTPGNIVAPAPIHAFLPIWTGLQVMTCRSYRLWLLEMSCTLAAIIAPSSMVIVAECEVSCVGGMIQAFE